MNNVERFRAAMDYAPRDRAPFKEFPWPTWPETSERWAREGGYDPEQTDFGCDRWIIEYSWFMPYPPFDKVVLDEDETHVTYVDPQGIVLREMKHNPLSSMPQFLRYPVATPEDFRRFWRERMRPELGGRIGENWRAQLRKHRDRDCPLVVIADRWGGFFGSLRNLTGVERLVSCSTTIRHSSRNDGRHAEFLIAMLGPMSRKPPSTYSGSGKTWPTALRRCLADDACGDTCFPGIAR